MDTEKKLIICNTEIFIACVFHSFTVNAASYRVTIICWFAVIRSMHENKYSNIRLYPIKDTVYYGTFVWNCLVHKHNLI